MLNIVNTIKINQIEQNLRFSRTWGGDKMNLIFPKFQQGIIQQFN